MNAHGKHSYAGFYFICADRRGLVTPEYLANMSQYRKPVVQPLPYSPSSYPKQPQNNTPTSVPTSNAPSNSGVMMLGAVQHTPSQHGRADHTEPSTPRLSQQQQQKQVASSPPRAATPRAVRGKSEDLNKQAEAEPVMISAPTATTATASIAAVVPSARQITALRNQQHHLQCSQPDTSVLTNGLYYQKNYPPKPSVVTDAFQHQPNTSESEQLVSHSSKPSATQNHHINEEYLQILNSDLGTNPPPPSSTNLQYGSLKRHPVQGSKSAADQASTDHGSQAYLIGSSYDLDLDSIGDISDIMGDNAQSRSFAHSRSSEALQKDFLNGPGAIVWPLLLLLCKFKFLHNNQLIINVNQTCF